MLNPELISVWLIVLPEASKYPVTFPELAVVVQVKVVPATSAVREIFVLLFEQILFERGEFVTWGVGSTVTK